MKLNTELNGVRMVSSDDMSGGRRVIYDMNFLPNKKTLLPRAS